MNINHLLFLKLVVPISAIEWSGFTDPLRRVGVVYVRIDGWDWVEVFDFPIEVFDLIFSKDDDHPGSLWSMLTNVQRRIGVDQ